MSVDLLAGVDISTVRIDVALIPLDPRLAEPVLVRQFPLRNAGDDISRLRILRGAMRELLRNPYGDVIECAVEQPFSGSSFKAAVPLNRVLGAITASIPVATNVVWLSAHDWRRELGATNLNSKPAGHDAVRPLAAAMPIHHGLDEHQLDALGLALAWRSLLDRHRPSTFQDQED